ncbi:MAG: hypothetical protein AAF717_20640 [Bacteroidota bacterium]
MEARTITEKEKELEEMIEVGRYTTVWLIVALTTSFGCYLMFF